MEPDGTDPGAPAEAGGKPRRVTGGPAVARRSKMRGKGRARMEEDGLSGEPLKEDYDAPALFMSSPLRVAVKGGMGKPLEVGCTEP